MRTASQAAPAGLFVIHVQRGQAAHEPPQHPIAVWSLWAGSVGLLQRHHWSSPGSVESALAPGSSATSVSLSALAPVLA